MRRNKRNYASVRTFSFNVEMYATAKHFRDYCSENGFIMSYVLDKMMVNFLIEKGMVNSEESLRLEEEKNQ